MIVVYLGDTDEYLCKLACSKDANAKHLTNNNVDNLTSGTYFTSLGDLDGLFNLGKVLQQADKIIYAPPPDGNWSGGDTMKNWTEEYLRTFSFRVYIENFSLPVIDNHKSILKLADKRQTDDPQIWIAGAGVSHGVGINEHERYGQLLANQLNLPASFLTSGSESVAWASDQILRSDIRAGDIVVWGLPYDRPVRTSPSLYQWYTQSLYYINQFSQQSLDTEILPNADFYQNLTSIHQVINFCDKIKSNLIIASFLDNNIIYYLKDVENLIVLSGIWGKDYDELFLDCGWDNHHPGPVTHKFYADEIYKKISELNLMR
jgi:hypothetical protein